MARTFAQENARLRREIVLLRKAGEQRTAALFDAVHVKGPDVASASTVILNDPYCDITGTTTITAIGERPIGDIRRVCFKGILTLTHNATSLILPGAANITTRVNDQAELVSLGSGNWQVTKYVTSSGPPPGLFLDDIQLYQGSVESSADMDLTIGTSANQGEYVEVTNGNYPSVATTIETIAAQAAGNVRKIIFPPGEGYLPILCGDGTLESIIIPGVTEGENLWLSENDVVEITADPAGAGWQVTNYFPGNWSSRIYRWPTPGLRISPSNAVNTAQSSGSSCRTVGVYPYKTGMVPLLSTNQPGYLYRVPSDASLNIKTYDATQSGTTTNGSAVVTGLTNTDQLIAGMSVVGTNIPVGATILSINSATQITLSANATGSATTSLTITIPASKAVDLFLINTMDQVTQTTPTGTMAVRFGSLWTSGTSRTDAIEATTYPGLYVNTNIISANANRQIPAAKGIYIGTVYMTSTAGQFEDTNTKRFIWNAYNRLPRKLKVTDTTDSWSYTTATWRQANNSAANQVEWIVGLSEDLVDLRVHGLANNATNNVNVATGIGIDSKNVNSADVYGGSALTTGMSVIPAQYIGYPGIGYHYGAWLEISAATGTTNWRGDNGLTYQQSGMIGTVWC